MSDTLRKKKGGNGHQQNSPDEASLMQNDSVLQYQNKALASLNLNYKQEIAQLKKIIYQKERETDKWNKSFANFTLALQRADMELGNLLMQQFELREFEDPLKLQQYLVDKQSSLYKNLINLIYEENQFNVPPQADSQEEAQSSKHTADVQMRSADEELKDSEEEQKLRDASQQLSKAFVSTMQRYIQALKSNDLRLSTKGINISPINSYQFQGNLEFGVQQLQSLQNEDLLKEISLLKGVNDELKQKINFKTSNSIRLEKQMKDIETLNVTLTQKLSGIQRDLNVQKELNQKLNLRLARGSPYYQIIASFFPNDMHKFYDKNHTCICMLCSKELNMNAIANLNSTEQSSNPIIEGKSNIQKQLILEQKNENQPNILPNQEGGRSEEKQDASSNSNPEKDAKIQELQIQVQSMNILNQEYCKRIEQLKQQNELTEDKFQQSQIYKMLAAQTQNLAQEITKNHQMGLSLNQLKHQNKILKSQKEQAEQAQKFEVQKLTEEVAGLRERANNLDQKYYKTSQANISVSDEKIKLENELSQIKVQAALNTLHDDTINNLKRLLQEAVARADQSEKRLAELQKKNDDYKRAYSDTKSNYQKAQGDIEKLRNPAGQPPIVESEIKEKYESLKHKNRKLEDQMKISQKKITDLENDVKQKQATLDSLYQDIQSVYDQLEESQNTLTKITSELKISQEKVVTLSSSEMTNRNSLEMALNDKDKLERKCLQLEQQLNDFRDLSKVNEESLEKLNSLVKDLETHQQSLQEAYDDLKQESQEALRKEKDTYDRLNSLQNVVNNQSQKLVGEKSQIDNLEAEIEQIKKSKSTLNGSNAGSMSELEYFQLKSMKYDSRMKCPICGVKEKEVILPCMHMYCNDCIQKNLNSRQRQCPTDRIRFDRADVKFVIWGDGQ
ncbi:ring zinc finger-containing protein [Stylonychia lemnae]|uniref:E3 ubiquitin protein ligase n=1 Tax=Stylonychia lemnae TaxID=5949 RepID=A0A078A6L7_STYLE|nr:ring zinc finger-containing protein [Stylonychia lemnae]|eukprot:CDW77526.1 ring zinc finger-containing protein [Stylonychia lemnae]